MLWSRLLFGQCVEENQTYFRKKTVNISFSQLYGIIDKVSSELNIFTQISFQKIEVIMYCNVKVQISWFLIEMELEQTSKSLV